jgi:hypothetical protein
MLVARQQSAWLKRTRLLMHNICMSTPTFQSPMQLACAQSDDGFEPTVLNLRERRFEFDP